MKLPISWHVDNVMNAQKSLDETRASIARLTKAADEFERQIEFHRRQIEGARRRGLEASDPDKFLIARKGKR